MLGLRLRWTRVRPSAQGCVFYKVFIRRENRRAYARSSKAAIVSFDEFQWHPRGHWAGVCCKEPDKKMVLNERLWVNIGVCWMLWILGWSVGFRIGFPKNPEYWPGRMSTRLRVLGQSGFKCVVGYLWGICPMTKGCKVFLSSLHFLVHCWNSRCGIHTLCT